MAIETRVKQYGAVLGGWQTGNYIGSGSGGKTAVFRLTRSSYGWEESSALKVINIIEESGSRESLPESYRNDYEKEAEQLQEKAVEEVRLMYSLRGCPNIVNYLDYAIEEWETDTHFGRDLLIRMELLKNLEDLRKEKGHLGEEEVLRIGKEICQALAYCHGKNIMHRDIKPANIFISDQGVYKLGDFGVARMVKESQKASTMTGTRAYAAPEQFAQNGDDLYDRRVDIYSLGLTMYELCNQGRLPFASSSYVRDDEIQMRIMGKPLPAPSEAGSALADIILKACAWRPADRYQTAEEFLEALNHIGSRAGQGAESGLQGEKEKTVKEETHDPYATAPALAGNRGTEKTGGIEKSGGNPQNRGNGGSPTRGYSSGGRSGGGGKMAGYSSGGGNARQMEIRRASSGSAGRDGRNVSRDNRRGQQPQQRKKQNNGIITAMIVLMVIIIAILLLVIGLMIKDNIFADAYTGNSTPAVQQEQRIGEELISVAYEQAKGYSK